MNNGFKQPNNTLLRYSSIVDIFRRPRNIKKYLKTLSVLPGQQTRQNLRT